MIPTPFQRPAMPPTGPMSDPQEPEETQEMEVEHGPIPPEAVAYHDSNERCDSCEYLEASGMCAYLKTQVDPGGHCTLYRMGERGAADMDDGTVAE